MNYGAELSEKTATAIESIQTNSQKVMDNFQSVSGMLTEHVKAANEIATRISEIQDTTNLNSQAVNDVSEAVVNLGKMAEQLNQQVVKFKV